MASGLPRTVWLNNLNGSHVLNLSLTTHKAAFFNTTYQAALAYDTIAGWTATNEVTGTGWAAAPTLALMQGAGATSVNPTIAAVAGGIVRYDMDDLARTTTSLTSVAGVQFYADAITTPTADPIYCIVDFGGLYTTTSGTFGITWSGQGVFEIDLS